MSYATTHDPLPGSGASSSKRPDSYSTLEENSPFAEKSLLRRVWRYILIGLSMPEPPPRIVRTPREYYRS